MTRDAQAKVMTALTALALALTFIACGFAVCAGIPATTEMLSRATSAESASPFSQEQLVDAALATRAYTVEGTERGELFSVVERINREAGTPYADATPDALSAAPDAYTLTPDALDHLDDVHGVIERLMPALLGCAVLAAFCLMVSLRQFPTRIVGRALLIAGDGVIALFAVLLVWTMLDFDGFFAAIHSLFFAAGTWTFPYDSLLICMYPQAFWMGMGAVWLASTAALSILSVVFGIAVTRKAKRSEPQRNA